MDLRLNRRHFVAGAVAGATGCLLLPTFALAEPSVGEITVENDHTACVWIRVYHPDAPNRIFGTWYFNASQTSILELNSANVRARDEWGIQVKFENGVTSKIQILGRVGYFQDGRWKIKASHIYEPYNNPSSSIKKISGYSIDSQFGAQETALLKDALGLFYQRFHQNHWHVMPELGTMAGSRREFDRSYEETFHVTDDREYLEHQIIRMEEPFPEVRLEYGNEKHADWVAQAYIGIVKVFTSLGYTDKDIEDGKFHRWEGSFSIQINDWFLNNGSLGAHYTNPAYWAGVIAHEAMHNLGHKHLPSRQENGYYLYQMILIEQLVMTNGNARYGDEFPTPVLCRPRLA